MRTASPNRRTFLGWLAGLPGLGFLIGCLPTRKAKETTDLLSVVCERLIPSHDGPGAREAGVADYVRQVLAGYHASLRPMIEEGLLRIDRLSRNDFESPYVRLSGAEQDRILEFVQKGGEDDDSFRGGVFVHRLLELCMEGFLGDPVHGGNRNGAGWRYIGFTAEGPGQCRGEDH